MKAYRFILFALLLVLAACSQAPSPEATTDEDTLTSQVVLPGASGLVYYIVYDPSKAYPYSVNSYDQATSVKKVLYASKREMQSVAGTLNGSTVIISMRETENSSSDFEIYDVKNLAATKKTNNNFDDTNVSVTRVFTTLNISRYTMAWETQVSCGVLCFKRGIQVRSVSLLSPDSDKFISFGNGDLTQPSISGNGKYVTFVRKLGNTRSVELNEIGTNVSSIVASSGGLITTSYFDPSPSDDGKKVAYLSRTFIGLNVSHSIKLYSNGATSTIVSGASFSHPHLTADGKWLTYAQQVNGTYRIRTHDLLNNQVVDSTASASPVSHFAPFWQKANP
jgi:hypothetical protein